MQHIGTLITLLDELDEIFRHRQHLGTVPVDNATKNQILPETMLLSGCCTAAQPFEQLIKKLNNKINYLDEALMKLFTSTQLSHHFIKCDTTLLAL